MYLTEEAESLHKENIKLKQDLEELKEKIASFKENTFKENFTLSPGLIELFKKYDKYFEL